MFIAYAGDSVDIIVNVIEDGAHVAATIDTTTTRLSSHASAVPVVTTIGTGIYKISWSGLSPEISAGDLITAKVNGTIDGGSAWTEFGVPIFVLVDLSSINDIDGYTMLEAMRIMLSTLAGKISGADTDSPVFRDVADTKNRVSATTTSDGRTSVTIDAT